MPSKEYIRKYDISLLYLDEDPVSYIVEASDISDATDKLANRLDMDVSDVLNNMDEDSLRIYNPVKDEWVRNRPWWDEDKEPYEWEKEINPDTNNLMTARDKMVEPVKVGSKEAYYLVFNRDEIFKSLIAVEGHFRNFKSLKEDTVGYLNCIVKHAADAESHADEAISHALIAEDSETSRRFLELRDEIRSFRKFVQSSPITRDEGIKEIRKLRRNFEGFNPDYDVSKCETCGDSEEIMRDITKIISDIKNNSNPIAAHEVDVEDFLVMERKMAEQVIAKLSKKYGVEPPKLVISDKCYEPEIGLYTGASMGTPGRIMMCKTGVNLHVLVHEFWHHVQAKNGMHLDEGEAEKFAITLFASPPQKGLYAFHNHSHSDKKMAIRDTGPADWKDVGVIYGGELLGFSTGYGLRYLDTLRPQGWMGQPLSFWGDILGAAGGVIGALYLDAPLNLLSALVGGYLATDLVNHIIRIAPIAVVAVPPTVYTPPSVFTPPPGVVVPPVTVGRYQLV